MTTLDHPRIRKEEIPNLTFHKDIDVEQDENIISKLETATRLGNGYHSKVNIYFVADQGPMSVLTTIWATGTKYICLKGGIWLPISRIEHIESY
jgi:hypothetical protein